MAKLQGYG